MPDFVEKLERCFEDLWAVCPLGRPEVLTSAGAYVNKKGYHGLGRAFDLDAIFWQGTTFVTKQRSDYGELYHAVEAVLHQHFGTVLAYDYNAAHRDHFHVDDGQPVGFRPGSRTHTLFVQNVAKRIAGMPIDVSGAWDASTDQALNQLQTQWGLSGPLTTPKNWRRFLQAAAQKGFGGAPAAVVASDREASSPKLALRAVYEAIEEALGDSEERKQVETALTTFVSLDEVRPLVDA